MGIVLNVRFLVQVLKCALPAIQRVQIPGHTLKTLKKCSGNLKTKLHFKKQNILICKFKAILLILISGFDFVYTKKGQLLNCLQ